MSKLAIRKGQKKYIEELHATKTVVKEAKFYIEDLSRDFPFKYGNFEKEDLQKLGKIKTNDTKKEFILVPCQFIDDYRRLKKLPQTIPLKDLGYIAGITGINKDSFVLDSGAGSGGSACFFANIVKRVVTYELRDDHAKVVEKNIKRLNLKNITLKIQSVYEGVEEKNADLFLFDLPEPWNAINTADDALKVGGFLISYSPCIPSLMDFTNKIKEHDNFLVFDVVEIIERHWELEGRKVRPKTKGIGHSGFLVIVRKIL